MKAAMLKSSQVMTLPKPAPSPSPPLTPRSISLRKSRSTESLGSPVDSRISLSSDLRPPRPPFAASGSPSSSSSRKVSGHIRGLSFDGPAWKSRSQVYLPASSSVLDLTATKSGKEKGSAMTKSGSISPAKIIGILSGTSSTQIDVENVKKLRLLLRNESARYAIFPLPSSHTKPVIVGHKNSLV